MIVLFAIILLLTAEISQAEAMRMAPSCPYDPLLRQPVCYLVLDGPIEADTPARFQAVLSEQSRIGGYEFGNKVLLNSAAGGNLMAGLELGRMIRAAGLSTHVGRAPPYLGSSMEIGGECVSACAYAFLGGLVRSVQMGARLGFHRVSLPGSRDLPGDGGLASGQQISALLIGYLIEMGIDARILSVASNTPSSQMYYPTNEELESYGLVTPRGFGPFLLEPEGSGVVAVSERLDAPHEWGDIVKLTAYCTNDFAFLRLTTPGILPSDSAQSSGERIGTIWLNTHVIAPTRVLVYTDLRNDADDATFSHIDFVIDPADLALPDDAFLLMVHYTEKEMASVRGQGKFSAFARVELDAADQQKLAAAFRLCI